MFCQLREIALSLLNQNICELQKQRPVSKPKSDRSPFYNSPCTHHEPVLHSPLANPELSTAWGLRRKDALDGRIQLGGVHLVTSRVQLRPVLLHEQRDIPPMVRSQVHILNRNHLLLVLGGENDVQGVRLAVGDYLKHGSGAVILLHGKEASPGPFKLLEVEQEEESPLGMDGIDQVSKGTLRDRGDQVRVEDLIGGAVRIVSLHQGDPVVLPGDLDELKQVIHAIVVSTLWRVNNNNNQQSAFVWMQISIVFIKLLSITSVRSEC